LRVRIAKESEIAALMMSKLICLPGWSTKVTESSNGVFVITLADRNGRKVEITDIDVEETLLKAMSDAFTIEKQLSQNWNRFLFEMCIGNLEGLVLKIKYEDRLSGSWLVEIAEKRILYESRDHWLIFQLRKNKKWYDTCILRKEELTLGTYLSILRSMM
jgi:hypothetical protein